MSSLPNPKIFCFGLGFTSLSLCDRLRQSGWEIAGTVRSEQKANLLEKAGIQAFVFDGIEENPDVTKALHDSNYIVNSVPVPVPDSFDPIFNIYGSVIEACQNMRWFGYLSTTVVYGNHNGGWVNEETPCEPSGKRGLNRLAAERAWSGLSIPVHIFRLAGIYGPGRNALETIKAGKAKRIDKQGQVFSRIHVQDIATALKASMEKPKGKIGEPAIYNLCDDEPCEPRAVIEYGCQLLGVDPPPLVPYEEANLSPMGRTFYEDNKRVSNQKIKDELDVTLDYPNYRLALDELAKDLSR